MSNPKQDMTPEQAFKTLIETLEKLTPHISHIAHIKRTYYLAYIAEGFTPQEALELVKDLSKI